MKKNKLSNRIDKQFLQSTSHLFLEIELLFLMSEIKNLMKGHKFLENMESINGHICLYLASVGKTYLLFFCA